MASQYTMGATWACADLLRHLPAARAGLIRNHGVLEENSVVVALLDSAAAIAGKLDLISAGFLNLIPGRLVGT